MLFRSGLGIITVLSASSPTALAETGNSYKYLIKQMEAAVIGIFLMFVASKIDYKLWQKNYKIIYCICMILLLAVCALGREAGGAKRWLDMGFLSFQPSEVAKVGVIIFYSAWLTKNKEKLYDYIYKNQKSYIEMIYSRKKYEKYVLERSSLDSKEES